MSSKSQTQSPAPPANKNRKRTPPENVSEAIPPTQILQPEVNAAILPVIMSLCSDDESKRSFSSLSFQAMRDFIKDLESLAGEVANTRIAPRGDLFIQPANESQKTLLLNLQSIGPSTVKCARTASETEVKGVIFGVPLDESDDIIEELTKDQGVIRARRIFKANADTPPARQPTSTVLLAFSALQLLPPRVLIAARSFPVQSYTRRPIQCRNCWRFGHVDTNCSRDKKCRVCARSHATLVACAAAPKCSNCASGNHPADDPSCPVYAYRKKILDTVHSQNISFPQAVALLNQAPQTTQPPSFTPRPLAWSGTSPSNPPADPEPDKHTAHLQSQIDSMQAQIVDIKKSVQPLLALSDVVAANTAKMDAVLVGLGKISDYLLPLSPHLNMLVPLIPNLLNLVHNQAGQMLAPLPYTPPRPMPSVLLNDPLLNNCDNFMSDS